MVYWLQDRWSCTPECAVSELIRSEPTDLAPADTLAAAGQAANTAADTSAFSRYQARRPASTLATISAATWPALRRIWPRWEVRSPRLTCSAPPLRGRA